MKKKKNDFSTFDNPEPDGRDSRFDPIPWTNFRLDRVLSKKTKSQHCAHIIYLQPTTILHDIHMTFNDYGRIIEAYIIQSRREHMLNNVCINLKVFVSQGITAILWKLSHYYYQDQGYECLVHITVIMDQCHWQAQPALNNVKYL